MLALLGDDDLRQALSRPTPLRIFAIAQALRAGVGVDEIHALTRIDRWVLQALVPIRGIGRVEKKTDEQGASAAGVDERRARYRLEVQAPRPLCELLAQRGVQHRRCCRDVRDGGDFAECRLERRRPRATRHA